MKNKVLVLGSWQKCKAIKFKQEAKIIGELLAMLNFKLITGGGQGTSNFVAQWYKKNNGLKFTVYLPSDKEQKRVNELQGIKPDIIIKTKMDYPERNIMMIKKCDAVIAL